jgi:hypothetical protein
MMFCAGASSPVWAQNWSGSLPAVQFQETTLTFEVPDLEQLVGFTFYLGYSPSLFSTPSFSFAAPFDAGALVGPPVDDPVLAAPEGLLYSGALPIGFMEVAVLAGAEPVNFAGGLFTVTFTATDGIGDTEVYSRFTYSLDTNFEATIDLPVLSTTIAAVPEAETWAMMLAGLALVGFCAARRRNTPA